MVTAKEILFDFIISVWAELFTSRQNLILCKPALTTSLRNPEASSSQSFLNLVAF